MKENHSDATDSIEKLETKLFSLQSSGLSPAEAFSFINCYEEHRKTLLLIQQYDENKVEHESAPATKKYQLTAKTATMLISLLKENLSEMDENLQLFGSPLDGDIGRVLGNIYQTYANQNLYPTLESKGAHLFYFLIKDHVFVDGNKRIATFLLFLFLDMNDMLWITPPEISIISPSEPVISYNTIYSLAIFVAESDPKEKETIINLITSLIQFYKTPPPIHEY